MIGCNKCQKISGVLLLVLGLLFLLRDLGQWNFWNVNWWTAAFLLTGLCSVCMSRCKECQTCMMPGKKR